MHLQKIEIQGFKSFANKTVMEFNRGIAAIVGPNGSGKSNVADAIRWVMGEQSLKLLRGKKSEDVIFSGSDKKARLGMAEVSLHINNEDGAMAIDYPEVVITRRMHRSGEGEYLLNKNKVRLQDIVLLLAKSNFGQRSYSVIGQGMIDSILNSSSQERKEFFDEAAGVRQYQIKKEQAEQKLDRTKDNLRQAELLLQEIEPRLRTLTRQVRRLEKRETVEAELREVQKQYYSGLWQELKNELDVVSTQQNDTEKVKNEAAAKLRKVQNELEKIERETSREESFRQLQKEYNRVLDEKNTLLQEQASLKGRWEMESMQAGEVNKVWLTKRRELLVRTQQELSDDMEPLKKKLQSARSELERKRKDQAKVVSQFEDLEQTLLVARERLTANKPLPIPEIADHLRTIETRYAEFLKKLNTAESADDITRLKRQAQDIHHSLDKYTKEIARSAPTTTTEEVLRLQSELSNFLKSKDNLVNEINDLVVTVRTLEEKDLVLHDKQSEVESELERADKELRQLEGKDKDANAEDTEHKHLTAKIEKLDQELKTAREKITSFNQQEQEKKDYLFRLQKQFRDHQNELNAVTQTLNEHRVQQARLETRRDDLNREMREELPEPTVDDIAKDPKQFLGEQTAASLLDSIHQLKRQLELIGGIDEGVTDEFEQTNERHEFLKGQSEDLLAALASLEKAIGELDETIKQQFDRAFQKISAEFGRYFKMLFKGGSAKLVLQKSDILAEQDDYDEEEDDEEENSEEEKSPRQPKVIGKAISGIDIHAVPPGKRISSINMLSGGEKALTSIALICAIIANNPSPFVVLDEVDAALDEANSLKLANILDELAHSTQFISITHNRATMQKANLLYGVTMQSDGVSKILSVKMEEAEDVIARHGNR
ncbi:MAG: chromosome segregation SMC family protein [bacterium]|nr:chromosome segregation SMC family protein [bacterium]